MSLLHPRTPPHFPPSSSLLFSLSLHPSLLRLISLSPSISPTAPKGQSEGAEQSYAVPGCVAARVSTIYVFVAPRPARDLQRVAESGYMGNKGKAAKTSRERGPSRALPCFFRMGFQKPQGGSKRASAAPLVPPESILRGPTGLQEGSTTALGGPPTEPTNPAGSPSALKGPQEGPKRDQTSRRT